MLPSGEMASTLLEPVAGGRHEQEQRMLLSVLHVLSDVLSRGSTRRKLTESTTNGVHFARRHPHFGQRSLVNAAPILLHIQEPELSASTMR